MTHCGSTTRLTAAQALDLLSSQYNVRLTRYAQP